MYFALVRNLAYVRPRRARAVSLPFRRISLLLDLGEDTLGLVVDAMRTRRHLPVTFDLLLSAHVASLQRISRPGHRLSVWFGNLPLRSFSSSLHCSPRHPVEFDLR